MPTEARTARMASLVAFSEAMKTGKHSTPCEMQGDSRGNGMSVKSTGDISYPQTGRPPRLAFQNALNLEASETVKDLVHRSTAYPKARIDHGRAGDDILMRHHRKHGTFAGAEVYVKPNIDNAPAVPAQSSSSTQSYYPEQDLYIEKEVLGVVTRGKGGLRFRPFENSSPLFDRDGTQLFVQNQSGADPAAMQ